MIPTVLLLIVLLIGLMVAFAVFLRRRGGTTFRRACFRFGLLLYVGLVFSTYLDTRVIDRSPPPHAGVLHLPTRNVLAAAGANGSNGRRLLIHIVRASRVPPLPSDITDVHEIDFRWPASKRAWEWTIKTTTGSSQVGFQILQSGLISGAPSPTPTAPTPTGGAKLDCLLSLDATIFPRGTMSLPDGRPGLQVKRRSLSRGFERYFTSFLPRRNKVEPAFVVVARWVADDDPLQPVALSRFLEETPVFEKLRRSPRRTYTYADDMPQGGLRWLVHAGVGGGLLLLAAMLVSQRFDNPALAFIAVSLVAVLSTIALERYRVGRCGSVLNNPQATLGEKVAALEGLETIFHFSWSAERLADQLAANEDTPADLRRWSHKVARTLHRRNLE